ncbi:MAG TPA: MFS transporter [Acidimicrobiia bacterium]|jgi:MFS family permease
MTRLSLATRRTFRSLRFRNFKLFFFGQLISQAGTWLTMIALTLLVLHRTGSGLAIGILTACQFAPILVLGAWGGLVADRSDKRRLLLVTQTLEMLQSFALAALAFMPHAPLVAFYGTALAGGVMLAFDNPARRAFVSEMVPPDEVQNAVTLNSALMTSSRVIGPALAGLLVVTTGFGWCFTIDAISYLAVIASLWMMRTSELHTPPVARRAKGMVREGLRYVRRVPDLWVPLVMMTVVGTLTFNFSVVIPLFVEHTLHGNDGSYTLLYSVLSFGSLTGALVAAHRHAIGVRTIVVASVAFGAAMLLFSTAPSLVASFPIALLVGFTSVAFMTGSSAVVQLRSAPTMRGRVLALQAIVFIGSTPVGGPLLGAVCDRYGARAGLVVGGVAALAAGAWGYRKTRRMAGAGGTSVDGVDALEAEAAEMQVA